MSSMSSGKSGRGTGSFGRWPGARHHRQRKKLWTGNQPAIKTIMCTCLDTSFVISPCLLLSFLMPDDELSALHDDGNDDNDNDGHDDNDNDHQRLQGHSSDQFSDPGPTSSTPFDPLPSPTPINSRVTTDLSLMPFLLSAVLCCPLCSLPFDSPTTLHCGHTICSAHLADSCPVPSCSPQNNPTNPIIPSYSTVSFFPAESPPPTLPPPTYSSHVDVTISKVISLVSRVEAEQDAYPTVDHIDGNLSDDNDNDNTPPRPSRIRPRPNSTPSPPRIRKRRRYSPKPDHDDHDLLAHLRKQSTVQRSTPHDEPLLPSHPPSARNDILSHFQKDLLAELTCDICCTLFFQPVTTPCQHVRPHTLYYTLLLISHLDLLFQVSAPSARP